MTTLPDGWVSTTLDQVAVLRSERALPYSAEERAYIGLEQVEAHTNRILGTVPASSITSVSVRFKAGDVLYGRMRPYLNKVIAPNFDGLASPEFIVFASTPYLISGYLKLRLSSHDFVEFACAQISGDRPRVKFEQLGKFEFWLPPLNEQARIVEKVDGVLADLDIGVADLRVATAKLRQYRLSLRKAAVSGALSVGWRTLVSAKQSTASKDANRSEDATALVETVGSIRRGRWEALQHERYREKGKEPPEGWKDKYLEPSGVESLGLPALPKSWTWCSFAQVTEIQGGIQKQPSRVPVANKFPFLRVANVARDELRLDDVHEIELFSGELDRLRLLPGDLLIVEGNGSLTEIGRCAVWNDEIQDAVHQNHLIRARPILVSGGYLSTWLNSPQGMEILAKLAATTSGLYTLSVGKIGRIPVPLPPIGEQQQIMDVLSASLDQVTKQLEFVNVSLHHADMQRKNVLHTAFIGQLVDQNPKDEAAHSLLKGIQIYRAENARRSKPQTGSKLKALDQSEVIMQKICDVLNAAGGWIPAQEAFHRCGISDGTGITRLEELYSQLRQLDKDGLLESRRVGQHDELRLRSEASDET